ncbi:MAG: CBS domain-containing protein, partial [Deltaproteobacteria bacterium]|nr:CBS domain-containing protein [Deltaproteobacteria bacterium]
MLVKEWMSTKVITIDEEMTLPEAAQVMRENKISRLPVVSRQGKLIGIVTDQDIKAASPSKATALDIHELYYLLAKIKINGIMTKNLICISPEDTIPKAAAVMLKRKINGLPVLDSKGDLVGMLTQGDVFRVLTNLTGAYLGGVLMALELR